ncbi:CRE-INS-1 protein [Aphelenchoides besseyi]|nr:CRE-INS-1 protein [Aphelenchoides besseyi]
MSSHRVLLLFTCAFIVLAHQSDASLRLCGNKLTMTLKAICHNQICGGGFYYKKKRSSAETFVQTYENVPVKHKGITTMCCKRKCTLEYLQTYCCTQFVLPQTSN